MDLLPPLSRVIVMLFLVSLYIAATGCIGGERFAVTDILVSTYDSGGQNVWSKTIDSGKQDYATAIIEASDNGYAIAGSIADEPRSQAFPRVIRLDRNGEILWDRTLDSGTDEAVAIAQEQDGGFVVAMKSGRVAKLDNNGQQAWSRTFNYHIHAMIPNRDGGYAFAGDHTFGVDGNGSILWDQPFISTSILQAADGGYFAEESGVPSTYGTVFRLDQNGTRAWTAPVNSHEMGTITSLNETPQGLVEVVYTYPVRTKDKDLIQYMESEQINLGRNGTVTGTKPLVAVAPLTRTSDGGYAFEAYPFPGSNAFTSFPQSSWDIHLVRLSPEGQVTWDRSLDLGKWKSPQSILQTRGGGFVTLVVLGS